MEYQYQFTNSFRDQEPGGGGQPQSPQYFQSFDASHFTHPSKRRRRPYPTYTAQQKAEAVSLVNEGFPVKMITGLFGDSCSKSNPYRWRAEKRQREEAELERVRRLEAAEMERHQRARALRLQRQQEYRRRRAELQRLFMGMQATDWGARMSTDRPPILVILDPR